MRKRPLLQKSSRTRKNHTSNQQAEEVTLSRSEKPRRQTKETHLFEVAFKNRVVNEYFPGSYKPIRGQQGRWYPEECLVVACEESEVREVISNKLESRIILGVSLAKRMRLKREIKIKEVRRLD